MWFYVYISVKGKGGERGNQTQEIFLFLLCSVLLNVSALRAFFRRKREKFKFLSLKNPVK